MIGGSYGIGLPLVKILNKDFNVYVAWAPWVPYFTPSKTLLLRHRVRRSKAVTTHAHAIEGCRGTSCSTGTSRSPCFLRN